MVRVAVYVITLTLAAGPMTAGICHALCQPAVTAQAAAGESCHAPLAIESVDQGCGTGCPDARLVDALVTPQDVRTSVQDAAADAATGALRLLHTAVLNPAGQSPPRLFEKRAPALQFRL